ncbi:MAG: zf-TFIIB domain-containing protein [Algoriphagus sp.]|nr:zf-TFIIB domain-containing protein [Algoriphagus sp.]
MKCPTCSVALIMTERSGVEIDYCPECRGVWLDRGELDKIIERSAQPFKPGPQVFVSSEKPHYSKYDAYKYKKKKGFLGDLFDF